MIGQTILHYRLVERIGTGGTGEVYRAHDEVLDRDVALKVLPRSLLLDEAGSNAFRKEALALARLNHPNIAMVHDFGTDNGVSALVMELVPGETLRSRLKAGPLPEKDFLHLAVQLADGLAAAHEEGVIHRDLKPGNLIVRPDRLLKILDFGLNMLLGAEGNTQGATTTHSISRTLPYMSPEQIEGRVADARSDIYSAGALLYEMATGKRPFLEDQGLQLIDAILHRTPSKPSTLNPRITPKLEGIILKCLDRDAGRRYQSASELRGELEQEAARSLGAAPPPSTDQSVVPTLEFAHVLFIDIVEFSKLPMDDQQKTMRQLQRAVRATPEFIRAQAADELTRLPTGDGMALVFSGDSEAPLRCAIELTRALKGQSEIPLRMGIHSGPLYRMADINANRNVAGGGINIAQRVMDCGDAGHILVSEEMAKMLEHLGNWEGALQDLGEVAVKHGQRLHIYNFTFQGVGNAALPHGALPQTDQAPRIPPGAPQATPTPPRFPESTETKIDAGEIDALLSDAETKVSGSRQSCGAMLASLPAIFVIGASESAKTHTIIHSGLQPELLAGTVSQDGEIIPTRVANFWFARKTVFLEAGGKLCEDPKMWLRVVRRFSADKPGSILAGATLPPRAALVCCDCAKLIKPAGPDAVAGAAANLRARMEELSRELDIRLPVYVLFTKLDEIPFFDDFVTGVTNKEASRILGVTLPSTTPVAMNVPSPGKQYNDKKNLSAAFNSVFYSLADCRPALLSREQNAEKQCHIYEFPREFRKSGRQFVAFLLELCRSNSQGPGPFLRGFYFTGRRFVNPTALSSTLMTTSTMIFSASAIPAPNATTILRVEEVPAAGDEAAIQESLMMRQVPQWLFLDHVLSDAVLEDQSALNVSKRRIGIPFFRRFWSAPSLSPR